MIDVPSDIFNCLAFRLRFECGIIDFDNRELPSLGAVLGKHGRQVEDPFYENHRHSLLDSEPNLLSPNLCPGVHRSAARAAERRENRMAPVQSRT
jgi:hypothetical protein